MRLWKMHFRTHEPAVPSRPATHASEWPDDGFSPVGSGNTQQRRFSTPSHAWRPNPRIRVCEAFWSAWAGSGTRFPVGVAIAQCRWGLPFNENRILGVPPANENRRGHFRFLDRVHSAEPPAKSSSGESSSAFASPWFFCVQHGTTLPVFLRRTQLGTTCVPRP